MFSRITPWKGRLVAFVLALVTVAVIPLLITPGWSASHSHPDSPDINVVSPQWLADHGDDPNLRVLDVRINPLAYMAGHVPGAVHLADNTFRGPNGRLPVQYWQSPKIASLFSQAGVNDDSQVVIYADGPNILGATMVAYLLERSGHRAAVLDGGFTGYQEAGLPISQAFPQYEPGSFTMQENDSIRVSLDQVRQYVTDEADVVFIDPRPVALFAGEEEVFIRNGHIPGAKNIPWPLLTAGDDTLHQLKPREQLQALMVERGITPEDTIIVTCSTGREATLPYVVLKHLLDYPNVRVYEGSWTEYSAQADLPVATGYDPAMPPEATAATNPDNFLIYQLNQPAATAAQLVREYTESQDDWLFLAEIGLLGGDVTALKICYPAIGSDIVAAGLHTMAMMPCGHLAFYEDDGVPTLSMLDLGFMTELYPDPNLERAVQTARPAFHRMLADTLGIE
jgi:thiosulfate/3-mercaptopyruvate sulfurtransferase